MGQSLDMVTRVHDGRKHEEREDRTGLWIDKVLEVEEVMNKDKLEEIENEELRDKEEIMMSNEVN